MHKNKVELMGFLGGDAVVRTDKNKNQFITLRLATTKSRKNKETGKYVERTQWHNLVVFGKLAEFAAKLKKGAHIEIEGELQYSEYKGVQTASVRVYSILKLDRAEKAAAEDDFDETSTEEEERLFEQRKLADIRYDPFLQELSLRMVEHANPAVVNWAFLDLAALVCTIRSPKCDVCPLRNHCCFALAQRGDEGTPADTGAQEDHVSRPLRF